MTRRRHPEQLSIEDLTFAVRRSPRRRTIGITVERDGALRLALPARCPVKTAEEAVRGKLLWVRRKLAEYEAMGVPAARRFVTGERLPYRGRWYELRVTVEPHAPASMALCRGRFELSLPARGDGGEAALARTAFAAWCTAKATVVLKDRIARLGPVVGVKPMDVRVRDMGRRWGTCAAGTGVLSFHWETVLLPPQVLDYIVIHELAHLLEPNHGPKFWLRVERAVPDWRERRRWLRTDAPAYQI